MVSKVAVVVVLLQDVIVGAALEQHAVSLGSDRRHSPLLLHRTREAPLPPLRSLRPRSDHHRRRFYRLALRTGAIPRYDEREAAEVEGDWQAA